MFIYKINLRKDYIMEIIKFKKDKNNVYKIYFDDGNIISLYDDVIVKYNLLINKSMDINKFNEITNYNDFLDGYYKSIKYINKKLRTELEIEKYLKKLNIKKSDIDNIIELLYKDGYLNKELYYKAYINDKYNLSGDGPFKIKKELIMLGYKELDFVDYLFSLDWNTKLCKIINKKIKLNHKLSNNMFKNKVTNDLVKNGYDKKDIVDILNTIELNSDIDYLKKELEKIKNKYKTKYSGNELEFKIINYLYRKGFNIEDIKRCIDEE